MDVSTQTAHYKPMFGAGDGQEEIAKGVGQYGQLVIDPGGASGAVTYGRQELVYYVLDGTGTLRWEGQEVPISRDDYFYIPIGTKHQFINSREVPLKMIVMGFPIPGDIQVKPTRGLPIANARDVPFQVLGGHGATVSYRLLLGTTESERDRLAPAYQVLSLYIMDFKPGGTNKAHDHENAEEIYFMLQGNGEMVAGEPDGTSRRYPTATGDAFFFTRNSPVGFFSGTEPGQPHARILAVRSTYPDQK